MLKICAVALAASLAVSTSPRPAVAGAELASPPACQAEYDQVPKLPADGLPEYSPEFVDGILRLYGQAYATWDSPAEYQRKHPNVHGRAEYQRLTGLTKQYMETLFLTVRAITSVYLRSLGDDAHHAFAECERRHVIDEVAKLPDESNYPLKKEDVIATFQNLD